MAYRISLTVLATVLMASSPCWAAKHKVHAAESASADDGDAPAKSAPAAKGKTAHGKTTHGKTAEADDDADLVKGAVKAMRGKTARDDGDGEAPAKSKKASRLADADDTGDSPKSTKGKKSAHAARLADAGDGDDGDAPKATSRNRKSSEADDGSDDASARHKKPAHATRLADADDGDAPVRDKKHARARADETSDGDAGADDATGFYKKVHGKLVLVSEKDIIKTRIVHHRVVAADNGPFYHKVHGRTVRVTSVALAEYRKAHRPEADPNATALAAAAHAMTTGTMMPAKLSVVTPMGRLTQASVTQTRPQSAVSQAWSQTARAAATPLVTLAAVTDALSRLPQSLFNAPGAAPASAAAASQAPAEAPPAAPIPYMALAGQSANSRGDLNPQDAALYQAAFAQIDGGDFNGAEASLNQVSDKSLVGYVEYHKLASPAYSATYEELTQWLAQYGDQPMAMRVWALAKRKKPYGAPDPAYPSLMSNSAQAAANTGANALPGAVALDAHTSLDAAPQPGIDGGAPKLDLRDSDLTPKSARSAYNNGQYDMAVTLARKIGDHWVAGLANWRLKRYADAEAEFKFVSTDPSRDAWAQSAGAYWAGRCADRLNQADEARTFFKIAASFPFTFYGLIAEQKLGVTPAVILAKHGQTPTFAPDTRQVLSASLSDDFAWTHGNAQAQRLSALVQIGRAKDAQAEAQSAVQRASDGTERDHWLALAAYNHIQVSQLHATDHLFDATRYPAPTIKLKSGYAVDRALLFAVARRESKFNAKARSPAGAYGLLQLMPGTAALLENNSRFNSHPDMLFQPTVNMRVGQEYMEKLLDGPTVGGDLIRLIAAYNGGPGPVKDAVATLGPDAGDSILLMESIPVAETRQYVEEVAANYWIYHQILGEPNKTLAMAAAEKPVLVKGAAPAPLETRTVAEADATPHAAPGAAD